MSSSVTHFRGFAITRVSSGDGINMQLCMSDDIERKVLVT